MIAVDTNILIYAHRPDAEWHKPAQACIKSLAESRAVWALPWPCAHEFLSVATNPRIHKLPTPMAIAIQQLEMWIASPSCQVIGEELNHLQTLSTLVLSAKIQGPAIHDARIASICLSHGVSELWTADRDFMKFPALKAVNPLVG